VIRYTVQGFSKKTLKFLKATLDDERGLASKDLPLHLSRGHGHTYQFKRCRKPHTPSVVISLTPRERMDAKFGDNPALKNLSVTERGYPMRIYIDAVNWHTKPKDFGGSLTTYRQYLIQHEMGHCLGLDHEEPVPHQKCPVMYQQTKGTRQCQANPWFMRESGRKKRSTKKKKKKKSRHKVKERSTNKDLR